MEANSFEEINEGVECYPNFKDNHLTIGSKGIFAAEKQDTEMPSSQSSQNPAFKSRNVLTPTTRLSNVHKRLFEDASRRKLNRKKIEDQVKEKQELEIKQLVSPKKASFIQMQAIFQRLYNDSDAKKRGENRIVHIRSSKYIRKSSEQDLIKYVVKNQENLHRSSCKHTSSMSGTGSFLTPYTKKYPKHFSHDFL